MGMLDFFTGGKSGAAEDAMRRAEAAFGRVKLPTLSELTLPELQKYVEAGIITPAEAEVALQQRNAYEDMNVDQTGTAHQIDALNALAAIADSPEGTPMQQAQMENSLQKMRTADQGQIGAIEQSMAARGTPRALIQAAMASQVQGQNAQQAHMDAVNAQAAMYQNALNALSQQGQLGTSLQGQQNAQANQVAQAANAMQQFNAQNQQQAAQFNANQNQAARAYNAANRQSVSDRNTGTSNLRTQYNAQLPQQMFGNALEKAKGQAGAAQQVGNMFQQQGQQNAGIMSGLINLGTSFIPKPTPPGTDPTKVAGMAHGGIVGDDDPMYCADGMMIPGEAPFPGDTMANDTVPIMASPGEAVIPRSSVQQNPEAVSSLLGGEAEVIDPLDVATLLKAMRAIRMGVC